MSAPILPCVAVPGVGTLDGAEIDKLRRVALPLYSNDGRRTFGAQLAAARALYAGFDIMSVQSGSELFAEAGRALDYVERH